MVVLTRGQLAPSDGRSYEEFVEARTQALTSLVRSQGGLSGSHAVGSQAHSHLLASVELRQPRQSRRASDQLECSPGSDLWCSAALLP